MSSVTAKRLPAQQTNYQDISVVKLGGLGRKFVGLI